MFRSSLLFIFTFSPRPLQVPFGPGMPCIVWGLCCHPSCHFLSIAILICPFDNILDRQKFSHPSPKGPHFGLKAQLVFYIFFLQTGRHSAEFWRLSTLACFIAIKLTIWFPFNNSFPKMIYIPKILSTPRGNHLSTHVQFWKAESLLPNLLWALWNYWHICPNMLLCNID